MQLLFLLRHLQHIPCPPQKAYPCRGAQPGQLFADVGDVHPHHAAIHVAVPAPHVGEQLVGGHHKAGPLHEHLQDLELPPAEALAFPLPAQLIGGTVQGKAAHRQQIRQVILFAAEHSPHPGQQLRGGAGLGEVPNCVRRRLDCHHVG